MGHSATSKATLSEQSLGHCHLPALTKGISVPFTSLLTPSGCEPPPPGCSCSPTCPLVSPAFQTAGLLAAQSRSRLPALSIHTHGGRCEFGISVLIEFMASPDLSGDTLNPPGLTFPGHLEHNCQSPVPHQCPLCLGRRRPPSQAHKHSPA